MYGGPMPPQTSPSRSQASVNLYIYIYMRDVVELYKGKKR
jgi:hypothetical protein